MSKDKVTDAAWGVLEVAYTATPEDAQGKFDQIVATLDEAEVAEEIRRPTHRSRIAWDNGTLSYIFEASVLRLDEEKAVEALMSHGIIDNPASVVVAA